MAAAERPGVDLNAWLFGLEALDVRLAAYYFFALWKALNIVLFFVPWAGLKWKAVSLSE